MERNLLEREIAALQGAEHFFTYFPWRVTPKIIAQMYQTKLPGKVTEVSFLRKADLKTREKTNGKDIYYLPNQWIDILGENGDWFLVEGTAAFMDGRKEKPYLVGGSPGKIQGWIKKSWVIYKTPPKLVEESKNGYTCYVEIDLNLKASANNKGWLADKDFNITAWVVDFPEQKTAIYVPDTFKPDVETDMIIYLHGHLKDQPGMISKGKDKYNSPSIQDYLNYAARPYFDFRQIIKNSKKNVVFVAPTLGPRSQYGNLGINFDNYVDQVIWAINDYAIKGRNQKGRFILKDLIIASHSGGGSPMLNIAGQSNSTYRKRIKSYWGFDAWYNSICVKRDADGKCTAVTSPWNGIAKDKSFTIYAYPYDSSPYPIEDKKTVFVTFPEQKLKDQTGKSESLHFTLLPYYFNERIRSL